MAIFRIFVLGYSKAPTQPPNSAWTYVSAHYDTAGTWTRDTVH